MFGGDVLCHENWIGAQPVSKIEQFLGFPRAFRDDVDVQEKCLALVIDGTDPQRPRLRTRIAIPLPPESERDENVIDGAQMPFITIGNDEIEISLASTARYGAATNVLDRRIP